MLAVGSIVAHQVLWRMVMSELVKCFEVAVLDEGITYLQRLKTNIEKPK